jgi:hypothetical protein
MSGINASSRGSSLAEEELARLLEGSLRARMPREWRIETLPQQKLGRARPDFVLDLQAPDGRRAAIIMEVKTRLDPKYTIAALTQARGFAWALQEQARRDPRSIGIVIGSDFLSPRTRQLLAAEGAGYVDLTGNLRIAVNDPPIFIELTGEESNPWPDDRPLRSLKGAAAGRAVRALCDFRPPYGVKELSERSDTPIATISRVVNLLDTEALLTREPRGPVTDVRWADLIRRWTQDYSFSASNSVSSYLEPRGLTALLNKIPTLSARYAFTGSLAATDLASITAPRLAAIFVDSSLDEVAGQLGLRPAETGANVLLIRPYDDVVFDRPRLRDGLTCVSPSQVTADLLTGPGRSPAEGEALIEWMGQHENDWRA